MPNSDLQGGAHEQARPAKPTPTQATKPKRRSPLFLSLIWRSACCLAFRSLLVIPISDWQDHEEDPQARLDFGSEARHHQDQEARDSSCN